MASTVEDLRPCWFMVRLHDYWKSGLFHQWGSAAGMEPGEASYTVGIVEDAVLHTIHMLPPEWVSFSAVDPDEGRADK